MFSFSVVSNVAYDNSNPCASVIFIGSTCVNNLLVLLSVLVCSFFISINAAEFEGSSSEINGL